jgi:phage repressor protein C with HTH and peptisase S24 domain
MGEFSESLVNKKFREVFDALEKSNKIKGKSDLATKLNTYNHVINSILKGDRNITVEQMHKLFETYNINANYLFGLSNDIYLDGSDDFPVRLKSESNTLGRQNITLVTDRATAGYAMALDTPQSGFQLGGAFAPYLQDFPKFSIPKMEGNLIAFEISGDSMMPTITNGDLVVCEALERGEPIRDNQVYVVVTDVVVAKRIQPIKSGSILKEMRLISDNDRYQPYTVSPEEVRQILRVKCRLTSHAIQ